MAEQPPAALVRLLIEDVFNRHRFATIDELFAPEPRRALDEHEESIEHFKARVRVYLAAFPDLRVTIDQLLAEETDVMVRWTARGMHTGPLAGLPPAVALGEPLHDQDSVLRIPIQLYPTGRAVRIQGVSSLRVEHGKVTRYWVLTDDLGLLRQLGAMPVVQSSG